MTTKLYTITRTPEGVNAHADAVPLRHVIVHSPTGFEYGYGGSGPADLALSILADYFGEQPSEYDRNTGNGHCFKFHQPFKWKFIASQTAQGFSIRREDIEEWLREEFGLIPEAAG